MNISNISKRFEMDVLTVIKYSQTFPANFDKIFQRPDEYKYEIECIKQYITIIRT